VRKFPWGTERERAKGRSEKVPLGDRERERERRGEVRKFPWGDRDCQCSKTSKFVLTM